MPLSLSGPLVALSSGGFGPLPAGGHGVGAGQDARLELELPLGDLRGHVALVTQEHHVFVGTLREGTAVRFTAPASTAPASAPARSAP